MCSNDGGGALAAAFPGKISQVECQQMVDTLANNKTVAILLQAGLPEGTKIAHKHAYATESDGLIHTMGDSGIIYTPVVIILSQYFCMTLFNWFGIHRIKWSLSCLKRYITTSM